MKGKGFSVEWAQEVASSYDYVEISHNEKSRVVSFRKNDTRINVYYTTGTVGTCLNHPSQGKTQLFRRNVGMNELAAIFENPRVHTGKGYYYRKQLHEKWKSTEGTPVQSDMARRWVYVCETTGLVNVNESVLQQVASCMNRIHDLLWDDSVPPTMSEMRYGCGSKSAMAELILDIAHQDGAIGAFHSNGKDDEIKRAETECLCDNYDAFVSCAQAELERVKEQLRCLPRSVRTQICDWMVGLLYCGWTLVTAEGDPFAPDEGNRLHTAHCDYAETFYPKKKLPMMCKQHGVLCGDL